MGFPLYEDDKMARVLWCSVLLLETNPPNLRGGTVLRLLPPPEGFINDSKLVLHYFLGFS